jgi:hypothetical protein
MSSIASAGRTAIAPFFVVSAVMEVGAGLALLAVPDLVLRLVFDASAAETGVALARLAGVALLSLGTACWLARHDAVSAAARALVGGMLIYNAAVVGLALSGSLGAVGLLLSGAAFLHGGMTVWCLLWLRGVRRLQV